MIAALTKANAQISSDNLKKQNVLGGDSEPASKVQGQVTV
jgi:hypothetical protein